MKDYIEINSKARLHLDSVPVRSKMLYKDEHDYKDILDKNRNQLEQYQKLLYAEHSRSLLVIFQGMDTSGKDGAIKHVMSGLNPQGCVVETFKEPSTQELDHDFLWKAHSRMPARGEIGIFNRSYYEEVLITRVHPLLLAKENIPDVKKYNKAFWQRRYYDITHFESYLRREGCEIIKIFIHISKLEQKRRLLSRFDDPSKMWKISDADVIERGFWKEYQKAYQHAITHTATKENPWYIVPGDDKENARLIISKILLDRLAKMKLAYPQVDLKEKRKLQSLKKRLLK